MKKKRRQRSLSRCSLTPPMLQTQKSPSVQLGDLAILWRSGRQSTIALSTAEAELNEVIEGMIAGEAVGVIADELFGPVSRMAWTDSRARKLNLTRHLRLRAAFARQAIQQRLWNIGHVPGEHMVADIGTKALTSGRLEELKIKEAQYGKPTGDPR